MVTGTNARGDKRGASPKPDDAHPAKIEFQNSKNSMIKVGGGKDVAKAIGAAGTNVQTGWVDKVKVYFGGSKAKVDAIKKSVDKNKKKEKKKARKKAKAAGEELSASEEEEDESDEADDGAWLHAMVAIATWGDAEDTRRV